MSKMGKVLDLKRKLIQNQKDFNKAVEAKDIKKQEELLNSLIEIEIEFKEITKRGIHQ